MNKSVFLLLFSIIWTLKCSNLAAQTYDDYITESFDYIDQDSISLAEELLYKALQLEPGNPENGLVLLNMGTLQRRQGKLQEAADSYTIGLAFLPDNLTLLINRAQLYAEMEEYGKAIEDYTQVIYKEPNNEDALYQRALCRLVNADTVGAKLDLELINSLNPNSAKSRLGMAYVYKAKRQWREAAEIYDELIKRNPKSPSLFRERAEVHYLSGRMGAALDDITNSLNIDSRDPFSYILRAQIRFARGDKEFARRDLNKAIELGLKPEEAGDLVQKLK